MEEEQKELRELMLFSSVVGWVFSPPTNNAKHYVITREMKFMSCWFASFKTLLKYRTPGTEETIRDIRTMEVVTSWLKRRSWFKRKVWHATASDNTVNLRKSCFQDLIQKEKP